jgi:hypothetical protein
LCCCPTAPKPRIGHEEEDGVSVNGCKCWFIAAQQNRHRVHEGKRVWGGQRTAQHSGSVTAQCETSCDTGGVVGGIRRACQHGKEKRRGLGSCRRQDCVGVHAVGDGAMVDVFTVMQCGFRARAGSPTVTTSRRGRGGRRKWEPDCGAYSECEGRTWRSHRREGRRRGGPAVHSPCTVVQPAAAWEAGTGR